MRYLAVDFGAKRVGLAICDVHQTLVSPLRTLARTDDAQVAAQIARIVDDESAGAVVVGLPVNMDGSEGPQAKRVRGFAELLGRATAVPLHFQNEQLSSFAADHRLAPRELTSAGRRARQDAVAAAVILEDFLRDHGAG